MLIHANLVPFIVLSTQIHLAILTFVLFFVWSKIIKEQHTEIQE